MYAGHGHLDAALKSLNEVPIKLYSTGPLVNHSRLIEEMHVANNLFRIAATNVIKHRNRALGESFQGSVVCSAATFNDMCRCRSRVRCRSFKGPSATFNDMCRCRSRVSLSFKGVVHAPPQRHMSLSLKVNTPHTKNLCSTHVQAFELDDTRNVSLEVHDTRHMSLDV